MADQSPESLSADEVERWADILTDELLNPKSFWRNVLLEGLGEPDVMRAMALRMRIPGIDRQLNPMLIPALRELIVSGNRDDIRSIVKKTLSETPRVAGAGSAMPTRWVRGLIVWVLRPLRGAGRSSQRSPMRQNYTRGVEDSLSWRGGRRPTLPIICSPGWSCIWRAS